MQIDMNDDPGSPEARKHGCTCSESLGGVVFMNDDCPEHGLKRVVHGCKCHYQLKRVLTSRDCPLHQHAETF